jgi:ribosomal protein S6--L-glutamate ligase
VNTAPHIHFLLVRRTPPGLGPVLTEVYDRLRSRGLEVDDSIPEERLVSPEELAVRHDLYVLKSHTELALSLAGTLCALGARLLNPHWGCLLTQDKVTSVKLLSDAGVPVPCSWVTDDYELLIPLLEEEPLIAKPHRGHLGKGIHILRSPKDIGRLSPAQGPFLFQRYLQTDGEDVKTYVVGRKVFAVTKRFAPDSYQIHGRPAELDARMRDIVLKCGEVLGLHLYGVDFVRTERGPFVVDVNYFPGYKGVPGAAELIADYIYTYALAGARAPSVPQGVLR